MIVGASHAGSLLAIQLRKEGWVGPIILIGLKNIALSSAAIVQSGISGEKEVQKILLRPALMYEKNNVQLRLGEQVTKIDRENKLIALSNGESIAYDKLALCTGATPKHLPIGEDLPGVHYLRDANDVAAIRADMSEGKHAIVIGGVILA